MNGKVYLLCDGEKFKIGVTSQSIEKRVKELQTGNPNEIWVHSIYECDRDLMYKIEKMMHFRHSGANVKNEWFDMTVDEVYNFEQECKKCEDLLKFINDNECL